MFKHLLLGSAALVTSMPASAQGAAPVAQIIDEAMNRGQVMMTAHEITDRIGPRLTNSPGMRRAEEWALAKFRTFGLSDVRRDGFAFGRGWEIVDSDVHMLTPRKLELTAIPVTWSPGTEGIVQAPVVIAPISNTEHLARWRGKLSGKIVLVTLPNDQTDPTEVPFQRLDNAELGKLDSYRQPRTDPAAQERGLGRATFQSELDAFLAAEGALAMIRMSRRDGLLVHGDNGIYQTGKTRKVPAFELAAEDYRRIARLAKVGDAPVLTLKSEVRFDDREPNAYSILADLPGSDPKAGYVMAGAHFDSWVAGDGATDNAAGSAVVLEAARLLARLPRPKRTIRFALWAGEEQGLIGSRAHIEKYLANKPGGADLTAPGGSTRWVNSFPMTPKAGWNQLKAYFNMDNGSGKFRGIYAEGNAAAVPLLKEWLSPFASMGATAVVADRSGGTDHVGIQAVGIPGFQFIQDPLAYSARTHHTSADTFDRLKADDLRQASVVMAGMLWAAANSDKELPRPPLPTQPTPTDPFKYEDPDVALPGR